MHFDREKIKRILVIKPGAIGDVLLSTPVIENLRHHFPYAIINFLTQSYCREVLTGNPYLTRILTYDIGKGDSSWCLIKNINKQEYDLIIDLFGNPRTAIIVFNSDAKYKVGFRFKWRALAYNIRVTPRGSKVHNVEFNLDALRALGLEIVTSRPKIFLNGVHVEFADTFFRSRRIDPSKTIGFNPSGTWPTKVWYKDKWIELGRKLSSDHNILLFWGYDEEKKLAEEIKSAIGENAILIPEANLKYMAALINKCRLFISNDTGPMHFSWITGTNTAAIFGPTNPDLQGPLSKNSIVLKNEALTCLGCNLTKIEECPYGHSCMKDLSSDYIYNKVIEFMSLNK